MCGFRRCGHVSANGHKIRHQSEGIVPCGDCLLTVEETLILCGLAFFFEELVPVFLRNINVYRVNLTIGVSETIRGRSENLKGKDVRELYYGND